MKDFTAMKAALAATGHKTAQAVREGAKSTAKAAADAVHTLPALRSKGAALLTRNKKTAGSAWHRVQKAVRKSSAIAKAFAIYCVLSAVLILCVAFMLQAHFSRKALSEANDAGRETVDIAAASLGTMLEMTRSAYALQSESEVLQQAVLSETLTADQQYALLALFSESNPANAYVDSVYLVNNASGMVYSSNGVSAARSSFFDKDALSLLNRNDVYTSRMAQFKLFGQQYIRRYLTCTFPLAGADGAATGGLIVNVDEEKLMSALRTRQEQAEYLYITDMRGNVIAHVDSAMIDLPLSVDMMNQINNGGEELQFTSAFENEECLVNVKKVPGLQMMFVSAYPVKHAENGALSVWLWVTAALAAAMLTGFALALLVAHVNMVNRQKAALAKPSLALEEFAVWNAQYSVDLSEIRNTVKTNERLLYAKASEAVLCMAEGSFASEEVCRTQLERCDIQLTKPLFLCIAVLLDDFAEATRNACPQNIFLHKYAAVHTACTLLGQRYPTVGSENGTGHAIVVINCDNADDLAFIRTALGDMQEALANKLGLHVSCGIGTYEAGFAGCAESYRHAMAAARCRLLLGKEHITAYADIAAEEARSIPYPAADAAILVQGDNQSRMKQAAESFVAEISKAGTASAAANIAQLEHQLLLAGGKAATAARLMMLRDTLNEKRDILLALAAGTPEAQGHTVAAGKDALQKKAVTHVTGAKTAKPKKSAKRNPAAPAESLAGSAEAAETTEAQAEKATIPAVQKTQSTAPAQTQTDDAPAEKAPAQASTAPAESSAKPQSSKDKKADMVKQACKYIQKHFCKASLSIDDVAKHVAVSPGYFRSGFKSVMHITPAEYLVQLRLEKAKELLLQTDDSSKDIAGHVGYDCRYFYSLFKSRMGMTAKEYREQNGKGGLADE